MNEKKPKISVVTSVYNGEKYIKEAIESILAQTFEDFEWIVIDDASTDQTAEILHRYAEKDARIKIFKNETNKKLAASLNKGVALAAGEYIVRMDADDICLENRLEKQYDFMRQNPKIDLSYCNFFAMEGQRLTPLRLGRRQDAESVAAMFLFFDPVLHPGVIAKSGVMKQYRYDLACTCTEDIDLWTRMLQDGVRIAGQRDFLMLYRIHAASISASTKEKQLTEVAKIEKRFFKAMLFEPTQEELAFYMNHIYFQDACDLKRLYRFYRKMMRANRAKRTFSKRHIVTAFFEVLAECQRKFEIGFCKKAAMIRFGGIGFLHEFFQKKKRFLRDVAAAEHAAEIAGFQRSKDAGAVPVYIRTGER